MKSVKMNVKPQSLLKSERFTSFSTSNIEKIEFLGIDFFEIAHNRFYKYRFFAGKLASLLYKNIRKRPVHNLLFKISLF
jgi:hypothetical protein